MTPDAAAAARLPTGRRRELALHEHDHVLVDVLGDCAASAAVIGRSARAPAPDSDGTATATTDWPATTADTAAAATAAERPDRLTWTHRPAAVPPRPAWCRSPCDPPAPVGEASACPRLGR